MLHPLDESLDNSGLMPASIWLVIFKFGLISATIGISIDLFSFLSGAVEIDNFNYGFLLGLVFLFTVFIVSQLAGFIPGLRSGVIFAFITSAVSYRQKFPIV